jgi:hypothetical protein
MTPPDGTMDNSVFPPFIPGGLTPRNEPAPAPAAASEPEASADEASGDAPLDFLGAETEAPAAAADFDAPGSEDLPWLELPSGSRVTADDEIDAEAPADPADAPAAEFATEPAEATATPAPATEPEGGAFPDWLAWDTRDSDRAAEEIADEPRASWADDVVVGEDLMEMEYAATAVDEDDDEDQPPLAGAAEDWAADEAVRAPGAGIDAALGDALAGVAARLERLAETLRERPGDLLSGDSSDPLDLLIAGYALGLAQGRARGGDG